jgi:DnaJ-class molecular chaperone
MIFCPHCKGLGKFFNGPKRFDVCGTCGGFGAIKKPKEEVTGTHGMIEYRKNGT